MDYHKLTETEKPVTEKDYKLNDDSGGILNLIYKNYRWIVFLIIVVFSIVLVILAFIEFGQEDKNETNMKALFATMFAIGCVLLILATGVYFFKRSKDKNAKPMPLIGQ